MNPPSILFIANAGPDVGGGHVMRSLTLARALRDRGADVAFLASPPVQAVLDVFGPDIPVHPISDLGANDLSVAVADLTFDAVVFDHYDLGRDQHHSLAKGRPTLVIDDLADRPLGADLVLDAGPARDARDYDGLAHGARLLLGPAYAPVRPAFAALRRMALQRRAEPVRRVLVALGLTDLGAITARVVERLQRLGDHFVFDIVVGGGASSLSRLRTLAAQDPRLQLHVDARDMAELTAAADIAVGAAGSTTWERCTLGLPSVLLVLAENQRPAAQALAARGAALVLDVADPDVEEALDKAVGWLVTDEALRRDLSNASAELCDGRGADRVAEAFLAIIAARHP